MILLQDEGQSCHLQVEDEERQQLAATAWALINSFLAAPQNSEGGKPHHRVQSLAAPHGSIDEMLAGRPAARRLGAGHGFNNGGRRPCRSAVGGQHGHAIGSGGGELEVPAGAAAQAPRQDLHHSHHGEGLQAAHGVIAICGLSRQCGLHHVRGSQRHMAQGRTRLIMIMMHRWL